MNTNQDRPTGHLMEFILSFLAPLLMAGGITDLTLARLAAAEAIAAYQTEGRNQLITISQILAFALAALDNLRLSMPQDLSLSMKLKLRGNANALNRSAQANTQILERQQPDWNRLDDKFSCQNNDLEHVGFFSQPENALHNAQLTVEPSIAEQAATASSPDPEPPTAPAETATPIQQQNNLHWATAMKKRAASLQAANLLPASNLSTAQQRTAGLWINALNDVANDLIHAKAPARPPGMTKAELMRSTLMSGHPSGAFPPLK